MARRPAVGTLVRMARRVLLPILIMLACTSPASAAERPAPPFSNADYWTFADDLMGRLDSWWDPGRGAYLLRGVPSVRVNSAFLLTHAIAAHAGHSGPARQDARARARQPADERAGVARRERARGSDDVLVTGTLPHQAQARIARAEGRRGVGMGLACPGGARTLGGRRRAGPAAGRHLCSERRLAARARRQPDQLERR